MTLSEHTQVGGKKPINKGLLAFGVGLVLAVAMMIWAVSGLLQSEAKPTKQVVEIQVIRPPPPPPPEVEEEPPPPEIEEELDVPEPEPLEDIPDLPDMPPPPEMLGLDAEGVAGSDAFGLQANRGGRSLVGGAGAHRWYAQKTKDVVSDFLGAQDALRAYQYRVRILVWVDAAGNTRFRLASSTGDEALDRRLDETLQRLGRMQEPPPVGLPQPISIRVVSHV